MCRMSCDIVWYLKQYGIKVLFQVKPWKHGHCWEDTVSRRFYKLIGCKLFGHQKNKFAYNGRTGTYDKPYCFKCHQEVIAP